MWPYGGAVGLGGLGLRGVFEPFWLGYPSWDAYGPTGLYPGYWASGYSPYPFEAPGLTGGLRLKIQPEEAQVYVDGYYSGIVDDFNGHFQHLDLPPGLHHVEVRAPGRQSLEVDVMIQARHTTVYKGTLAPLTP